MNHHILCPSCPKLDALPTFARHSCFKQQHRKSYRAPPVQSSRLRRFSAPPTILNCVGGYTFRIAKGDNRARVVVSSSKGPTNLEAVSMTTDNTRTGLSAVEKGLAMQRGSGERSYAMNSKDQEFLVKHMVAPELLKALDKTTLPDDGQPMVVVDLGCATGSNTINNVNLILNRLKERFIAAAAAGSNSATKLPELQVFFNDLPSNDFNYLFQLLSEQRDSPDYFVAGVPGSFYGRLFPRSSVHVFFSSFCLHWISKIPEALLDQNSPAFNKGDMWMVRGRSEVAEAYKEQAGLDLRNFLNARAEEMVPGGLLFLVFGGRTDPDPTRPMGANSFLYALWKCMDEAWETMVAQGHITEDHRDAYNVPLYFRSVEEVREAVESCGSAFHVEKLVTLETTAPKISDMLNTTSASEMIRRSARFVESLYGPLVEAHIGKELARVYWDNVEVRMAEKKLHDILLDWEKTPDGGRRRGDMNLIILIRS